MLVSLDLPRSALVVTDTFKAVEPPVYLMAFHVSTDVLAHLEKLETLQAQEWCLTKIMQNRDSIVRLRALYDRGELLCIYRKNVLYMYVLSLDQRCMALPMLRNPSLARKV